MTTVFDVPPRLLVTRLAARLKEEGKITPPEWAAHARTGTHTQEAPINRDWWYERTAAVLRKVYIRGPIGSTRLSAEFGGRRDRGSAPYHPVRGSRNIARTTLQQLEELGLIEKKGTKGRVVTAAGRAMLDRLAHEIVSELARSNPELTKYVRAK